MKNIDFKSFDFQKYSNQILALAAAIIIFLDFFFIMKPQIRWLKDLGTKIRQLKSQIEQTDRDIALIVQLQKQYQSSKKDMSDIERRVPQEEDIPLILQDISSAANSSMIKIFQIRPMKEEKEVILETKSGKYYRIPISIVAKGGYHLFGKFLNKLENSEIFMSINNLEISPSASDYKRHNINLIINTFIFKK
jgi:type IV pilus assembly protein PilO